MTDKDLSILIVEDSESDTELILRQFQKAHYTVSQERVETADQMRSALERQPWDVIIADYSLPQFDAPSALAVLQKSGLDVPFIVVSGTIGEEMAIALMKAGAHDCIMKHHLPRLVSAVERELSQAEMRRAKRQADEALRTSQRQLSEATDLAHIVYWELDPASQTYTFNDPFYVFHGTTAEQEGGYQMTREEYMQRFIHPDDLQFIRQKVGQNITKTGAEFFSDLEHRIIRRDGEVRHILVRASVAKDDSGRIVKRYGANQDITSRKEMANALEKSGEQFEKLFMDSPLGMVIVGADFLFIRANAAFCGMSGYTEKELTSLTFKDLTYPDQIAKDVVALNDLISGKAAIYRTEKQYIRKDKEVVWGSLTVNAIRDKDNLFLNFFTTVEDITIRKHAEEALNQSLKKLRKNLMGTILAITSMVEIRDPYTAGHEKRVSMLARAIAHELGLPNDVVDNIRMAASIHDIGKISVPAEILSKPGRLSDIEMKLIQVHSQTGYDILKDVDLPYPIARIVLQHHERLNGSGYPQSVKAGEILLEARIVSVADVVEAMASYRPYRPALGIDTALEEIEKNKGIFYDAVVVDACVRLFREKGFKLE